MLSGVFADHFLNNTNNCKNHM